MTDEKNKIEEGTLYLVATPIGNLSDLSPRAVKILTEVSFVAAEDTRMAAKLFMTLGIKKSMLPYHDHNRHEVGKTIISRLLSGESCALVTDAGTPAISDPGEELVAECVESGVSVTSVPGCCAAIAALTVSGLSARRFAFEGFLNGRVNERRQILERIRSDVRTQIFYEAPHRLLDTLQLMEEILGGERRIALCRELTKLNEEILRLEIGEAIAYYNKYVPRGEYVLVVEGYSESPETAFWANMTIKEHVDYYMKSGESKKMDAIKAVAKDRNVAKNEIYKALVK